MNLGSGYKVTKVGGKYQVEMSASGSDSAIEEMLKKAKFPTSGTTVSHTVTTTTTTYTTSDGKKQ